MRTIIGWGFLCVCLAACAPSTGGLPYLDPSDASAPADRAATACEAGQERCGDRCVDTGSNALHCGACGRACQSAESCVRGACAVLCPEGQSACEGRCVSLPSNALHCGACGRACANGEACVNGACAGQCATPRAVCGGVCVDPRSDVDHCGACGQRCAAGQSCVGGACGRNCPAGAVECGATCASLRSDPAHCGRCGNACPGGTTCVDGACQTQCAGGRTACGAACVDIATDPSNCGACGSACPSGQTCAGGMCRAACTAPMLACGGECVDPGSNRAHCGRCGVACPEGQNCVAGSCRAPTSPVRVAWTFPGLMRNPRTGELRFPTYLAHAFGLVADGTTAFRFQAACAALVNGAATAQTVSLQARMPGYASPRMQSVTLGPMESRSVCLNPVFDLARLYGLTAITAGALEADAQDAAGSYLARASQTVAVLPVGGVVWSLPGTPTPVMSALSTVQIAPLDSSVLTLRRDAEARSIYPGGFGADGYTRGILQRTRTLAAGGYHYVVLHNVDAAAPREVRYRPSNTRQDVAYDALASIYEELRARGFTYTNISTAYYQSEQVQYIRRPRELLASRTGNCIEGSILFASVLENMGMEPVIYRIPGHAFVGVRSAPGSEVVWPVETTLLGVTTFANAFTYGVREVLDNASLPLEDGHTIDVTNARRLGLRPIPM